MTSAGGQGELLAQVASGKVNTGVAEALLTHICHARPGSYRDLSEVRRAFVQAARATGSRDASPRSRIGLHLLGSLKLAEPDHHFEAMIADLPDGTTDLLRHKAGLFGVVDVEVAVAAYTRLLELRPDDDRSRLDLGALLISNKRVLEAAFVYRAVILRSERLQAIQEAAAQLHSAMVLLRLEGRSEGAHAAARMVLPKVLECMPWLAEEVKHRGPHVWDFHAAIAIVYWVLHAIRGERAPHPAGLVGGTVADLVAVYGCARPDRGEGLPDGEESERIRAFDDRWREAAAGALGDCAAFLHTGEDNQISYTGNWVLGACGGGEVDVDDAWLVGDALSTVARRYVEPLT